MRWLAGTHQKLNHQKTNFDGNMYNIIIIKGLFGSDFGLERNASYVVLQKIASDFK